VTIKRCDQCAYWVRSDADPASGWCHRYPPTASPDAEVDNLDNIGWWMNPVTEEDDWCGEWASKEHLASMPPGAL
jgi:hypothetical protein